MIPRRTYSAAEIHLTIGNPVERIYRYKGEEAQLGQVRAALEFYCREHRISIVH